MSAASPLNLARSHAEFARSRTLIPGGTLGIRRPYNFVEGEYPIFIESGAGGRITDVDGNEYADFLCAYGPIILGYREAEVDEAVIRQIRDRGFCFSLTQCFQSELAEAIRRHVPCAEMSLFVKTGSDATTCAVRLARAHTGRAGVLRCGYHGWHDWCVEVKGGIPQKLYEDVREFPYNDLDALEALVRTHGDDTAAIVLTPFGHPLAAPLQEPAPGFLEGVRALADRCGAVLVFDEIRTGFRLSMGGAQAYYGVTPDLACLGKAMANGYALAAVCGRAQVMRAAEKDVFVSSTYFPNSDGYVAALKTLEILEREDVLESIWQRGSAFYHRLQVVATNSDTGAQLSGVAPLFFLTFRKDPEGLYKLRRRDFYTQLIRRGVFMQPYHHSYLCWRHADADLEQAAEAVSGALRIVREAHGAFAE